MSAVACQLSGRDRKAWEDSVLDDKRVKKSTDVFLLSTLLRYCRGKAMCWPTLTTLAKQMRMTERTVHAAIKRLVKAGVLRLLKDTSLRQGRRFVIASHPGAEVAPSGRCAAKDDVADCRAARKIFPTKLGVKTEDSSDSSLRSESSSSPKRETERPTMVANAIPEEVQKQVREILPEKDATAILKDQRLIAQKVKGQYHLIPAACRLIRAKRDEVRGVVPYCAKLMEDWQGGIPEHFRPIATPQPPPGPPPMTPERMARIEWYNAYHARKAAEVKAKDAAKGSVSTGNIDCKARGLDSLEAKLRARPGRA